MRERYYSFKTSDGSHEVLTLAQAATLTDPLIKLRLDEIRMNIANVKRKHDGFEPGIQANTGMYAGGRLEYNRQLKELGLVEIGNDYTPKDSNGDYNYCQSDTFVESCIEAGIELFPEVLPMAVQTTWRLTSRLPMSSGGSKLGGAGEAILGEVRESWVAMGVALVHRESRQIGKCMLA